MMDEILEEDDSVTELEENFNKAAEHLKTLVDKLEKEQLLYFYARFKQTTVGKCNVPRPGFFDFQGKQKWDAWNSLGAMTKETAMEEYLTHMEGVDPSWQMTSKQKGGLGMSVSTMVNLDNKLRDEEKTIFDWCKEGSVQEVERFLQTNRIVVGQTDNEGMTLLHWSCDRGWLEVIDILLLHNADVNAKDDEARPHCIMLSIIAIYDDEGKGQISFTDFVIENLLVKAASCEHIEVVQLLLANGADPSIKDIDSCTPAEATSSTTIRELLEGAT